MGALIFIVAGNAVIYGIVRWFLVSDRVEEMGGSNTPNTIALGLCCLVVELFTVSNALDIAEADNLESIVSIAVFMLVCALPWGIPYFRLFVGITDNMAGATTGENVVAKQKIDMKEAYALIQNGRMDEAITELNLLKRANPNSPEPVFVLASIAHDKKEFAKEENFFREILNNENFPHNARINAAKSLKAHVEEHDPESYKIKKMEAEIARLDEEQKIIFSPKKTGKKEEDPGKHADKIPLNQARRHSSQGDFVAAIPLFKSYIAKNPDVSRTYFELISVYERQERTEDAVLWLQKTIKQFEGADIPWGDAMLRLASFREIQDDDIESATALLKDVAERLKHANHGKLARTRLMDLNKKSGQ